MSRVVIDIETLAFPLENFDDVQREYLLRFAESEEKRKETIQKLSLYATTARIIAIGLFNPDTSKSKVLFQADEKLDYFSQDESTHFISASEPELLSEFWKDITHYSQFITFNGRGFDCPFLMLRSAILQVKPTRNLLPARFDSSIHCDLLDQFTFYGSVRKFNLDFYCKAFSIESPKSHGVTGLDLARLFEEKRFQEIAEYCLGDLRATAELYRRWEKYLDI
ncbi:MAG: ribonuclease H-like domain-containing protein [Ignavibacteriales bacterium]|nr:ribonuclease H-like domain-containing protein [Ignavibacteriales bacterium]